jgi:hypothetical protein
MGSFEKSPSETSAFLSGMEIPSDFVCGLGSQERYDPGSLVVASMSLRMRPQHVHPYIPADFDSSLSLRATETRSKAAGC